ncbi:UDP-glucose dehydrogenase [Listeria phage LIS04]|nr:UDP-glucose dehydrogenase [Listeria phage LIS04]
MKIAIIGTGFVGLTSAVVYANSGHDVVGVDIDPRKVNSLNKGISTIYEDQVPEYLEKSVASGNLRFTMDYSEALEGTDAVIVTVGTPTENGVANLQYLKSAVYDICANQTTELVLVIKSTVPVGTCREIQQVCDSVRPGLIKVVSNPEFLAEGTAIRDTLNMSRVVIGSDHPSACVLVHQLNSPYSENFVCTSLESAELIKQASNAFLATKISFINGISQLCDKHQANIDDIAKGMGYDPRIGDKFLQAGLGFGGSCFPKDVTALQSMSSGNFKNLLQSVTQLNQDIRLSVVDKLVQLVGSSIKGKVITILGAAFKPNTNDIRESPAVTIIQYLTNLGAEIRVYDPAVDSREFLEVYNKYWGVEFCDTYEQALIDSEGCIICTEWDQIKSIDYSEYVNLMHTPNVVDGRGILNPDLAHSAGISLYSIGRPTSAYSTKSQQEA